MHLNDGITASAVRSHSRATCFVSRIPFTWRWIGHWIRLHITSPDMQRLVSSKSSRRALIRTKCDTPPHQTTCSLSCDMHGCRCRFNGRVGQSRRAAHAGRFPRTLKPAAAGRSPSPRRPRPRPPPSRCRRPRRRLSRPSRRGRRRRGSRSARCL